MGQQVDPRFAPDKIAEAINNLAANGKPLNACRVRDELGGGDHARIKEALSTYLEKEAKSTKNDIKSSSIPPEMEDTVDTLKVNFGVQLDRLAKSCFDVAMNTANLRVKSKIDEYNNDISSLEKAEMDAFESIERKDLANQELHEKIELLEAKNESLVAKNAELNALLVISKEQEAKLESKENEIANFRQQLGKLEGKLELLEK